MKELSLRPYNGRVFYAKTKGEYEAAHKRLFKTPDVLHCAQEGRFAGGEGKDGLWTYLVFADQPHTLAHEFSHVVFHVFERCGIDPSDSAGEAFCYLLGQLVLDAMPPKKAKLLTEDEIGRALSAHGQLTSPELFEVIQRVVLRKNGVMQ